MGRVSWADGVIVEGGGRYSSSAALGALLSVHCRFVGSSRMEFCDSIE